MKEDRLSYLFYRVIDGTASQSEKLELAELSVQPGYEQRLAELLGEGWDTYTSKDDIFSEAASTNILNKAIESDGRSTEVIPITRKSKYQFSWVKYAAAIILICGVSTYWWMASRNTKSNIAEDRSQSMAQIKPGGDKAILTLADGRTINLDSAANGNLASQAGVQIRKLASGQIAYEISSQPNEKVVWNTISTPKGGQYQLTLPDGTKVWLNAASSLRFPTAFTGKERRVEITGEGYFEVEHNAEKPFYVSVGKTEVKVLGTHFNVMAYEDEEAKQITLLQGSVLVSQASNNTKLIPGQQARVAADINVADNVDLEQVVAWKNGAFVFGESMSVEEVMRQIARWYDVDVVFRHKINGHIGGSVSRNANISEVLKILELTGAVKFEIVGRKVIVE
ncbi:FecR family protein [Pinibacter aurantiacus]|uniref:FecR domain-containing protein n=1 Tax=Pinibacter aurantiacus TaxID=2851599 RepID=A0A9E2SD60_9BACT|nr:FecR family protein [Pinibacter aurantiacus]MBV4360521.1 FecR domain-containing protein [Pinibacter aurantiacus]